MSQKFIPVVPKDIAADPYVSREWQKMLDGEIYDAGHPLFLKELIATRKKIKRYNDLDLESPELTTLLRDILGGCGRGTTNPCENPAKCLCVFNVH